MFQPAIPALDFLHSPGPDSVAAAASLPQELQFPLIKRSPPPATEVEVSPSEPGSRATLQGYASGVRSALVNVQGVWYRLKGCGNHESGFISKDERQPILKTQGGYDGVHNFRQIRGCAFPHTAVRELVISERVDSALRALDSGSACTAASCLYALTRCAFSWSQYSSCIHAVLWCC